MSSPKLVITEIFGNFQKHMNKEQDIREEIKLICKNIDQISRQATTVLQIIHYDEHAISGACQTARGLFAEARLEYAKLKLVVPDDEYYRYHDHWRNVTQRYSFLIALTIWLEVGTLATQETIAEILGVAAEEKKTGFHLDIEDFLVGLLQLSSELSRLAVNAVTRGDYQRPLQISQFVMDLNAGFRLLNMKNDYLRKRFDALKYDVKKIEEVVYDLSIRGFVQVPGSCTRPSVAAVKAVKEERIKEESIKEEKIKEERIKDEIKGE